MLMQICSFSHNADFEVFEQRLIDLIFYNGKKASSDTLQKLVNLGFTSEVLAQEYNNYVLILGQENSPIVFKKNE